MSLKGSCAKDLVLKAAMFRNRTFRKSLDQEWQSVNGLSSMVHQEVVETVRGAYSWGRTSLEESHWRVYFLPLALFHFLHSIVSLRVLRWCLSQFYDFRVLWNMFGLGSATSDGVKLSQTEVSEIINQNKHFHLWDDFLICFISETERWLSHKIQTSP